MQSMTCSFNLNRMFNIRNSFHVTSDGWMDADWESVRRFTTGQRSCWIDSEIDTFHIVTMCACVYRRLCACAGEKVMKWAVLWAFSRAWYRNSGPSKKVSASQDTECIWDLYFLNCSFLLIYREMNNKQTLGPLHSHPLWLLFNRLIALPNPLKSMPRLLTQQVPAGTLAWRHLQEHHV